MHSPHAAPGFSGPFFFRNGSILFRSPTRLAFFLDCGKPPLFRVTAGPGTDRGTAPGAAVSLLQIRLVACCVRAIGYSSTLIIVEAVVAGWSTSPPVVARPSRSTRSNTLAVVPMSAEEILLDADDRMEKAVQVLKSNLAGIRTGRANPGLVDSLRVEVYGSATPIKQLAQVGAPEATQIVIRPYDPGTLKDIEKAIVASDLGFNPQNDGRLIRIAVPPLSVEQRQRMVARIKDLTEEAKIAVRNIRRDSNKAMDLAQKNKEISEDERDTFKDEIQESTKKYEGQATAMAKSREIEVMD